MSDVKIRIIATDNASRTLNSVQGELRQIAPAANKANAGVGALSGGLSQLASIGGALAASGLVAGILSVGQASLMAASNAQEMASKFAVVFGGEAGRAETALSELAVTIGRSRYELMGYAASIQDTLVPLGLARDAAADLSIEIVALAEDLASFNNLSTADVMRALQSGLVGETEPLRQFGVVVNQATVEAKALEMGLIGVGDQLTAQARALATYQLVVEGTADAHGDAERTSDSLANSLRALEGATDELKVAVGNVIMPIGTGLVQALTTATRAATVLVTWQDKVRTAAQDAAAAAEVSTGSYAEYRAEMERIASVSRLTMMTTEEYQAMLARGGPQAAATMVLTMLTEAEYSAAQAAQYVYDEFSGLDDAIAAVSAAAADAAAGMEDLATEEEKAAARAELLESRLSRMTRFGDDFWGTLTDLTGKMQDYQRATGQVIPPSNELASLQLDNALAAINYQESIDKLAEAQQRYAEVQAELAGADPASEEYAALAAESLKAEKAVLQAQQGINKANEALEQTGRAVSAASGGIADYSQQVADLRAEISTMIEGAFVETLMSQLAIMAEAGETGSFDALLDGLRLINPELAAQLENSYALATATETLGTALATGSISAEQYAELVGQYTDAVAAGISPAELAEQAVKDLQAAQEAHAMGGLTLVDPIMQYAGAVDRVAYAADVAAGQVRKLIDAMGNMPLSPSAGGIDIGDIGGVGAAIVTAPGGTRAAGGIVYAGSSYLVGERGPEVVTFGQGGYVTPNSQLGQTVNITINNPTLNRREDIDALAEAVARRLR